MRGAGIQTAALAFGGTTVTGFATVATEEYDGNPLGQVLQDPLNTAKAYSLGAAGTTNCWFSIWWLHWYS
jgi:hypothetical protein